MSFPDSIKLFLDACPGPRQARTALRIAAFQPVKGIPGLAPADRSHENRYMTSTPQIAKRLECRPAYLARVGRTHGYSFPRALRWIRFLHGVTLLAEGASVETLTYRLGFSDKAGWSRFTKRLVGRGWAQLPAVPLDYWVRKGVDDVFFGVPACGEPN